VAVLLIFSACKTTKTISKGNVRAINPAVELLRKVQANQPSFNTANVKMTLDLNLNERRVNVSANCKIRKDTAIFVSFQFLGFEVYKAELMPDSMKVFDKMNRRYFVVDYSYFSNRFGVDVDFYSLQSLFTAQFFCIGSKDIHGDMCKLTEATADQKSIDYETDNMLQSTLISPLNVIQQVILKAKSSNYRMETSYADYKDVNGINFPQKIAISATNDKTNASCDFSILKAEFNTNVVLQPLSTRNLTRGDIDQILKK
jgi:hypothetical protein